MRRAYSIVCAFALLSDRAAADEAALKRALQSEKGKPRGYVAAGAKVQDPEGGALFTAEDGDPREVTVLDDKDGYLVAVDAPAARLVLRVDGLRPVVTREVGLARSQAATAPRSGEDGAFLDPGAAPAILERAGGRAHVELKGDVELQGWIPEDALATQFVPKKGVKHTWRYVGEGSRIVARDGTVLMKVHVLGLLRGIGKGRHELAWGHAFATGIYQKGDDDREEDGVEGGVEGGVAKDSPPNKVTVPAGSCLYSSSGAAVGVTSKARELEPGAAPEMYVWIPSLGDPKLQLHRGADGKFVSCK